VTIIDNNAKYTSKLSNDVFLTNDIINNQGILKNIVYFNQKNRDIHICKSAS
jgi:hypothetical protein